MALPILSQIGRAITNIGKYIGGFRSAFATVWGIGTKEVYSPIEQDTAISKGFNANTAVYSIVKKYAKKAASIERYLESTSTEEVIESHPLLQLLERPNPKQSSYSFFKLVYAFYKVCGESFIWLNRGDVTQMVDEEGNLVERSRDEYLKQPILEMWVIPANHITVLPDDSDPFTIKGYQLRNRPDIKFTGSDIIHWMDINLDWDEYSKPHTRGMTPLKPGFKTLTADNSFIDSMVRMAQNDGAKGAIVNKTLGKMSPKQETAVRNVIDEKVNNKEVKNAIAALEGDWTYLDFGLTSVDMQTLEAREFIYKEMCFLLDVPYGFFDSHTPYAEKQLAARDWISNSIRPDCKELDGELNRMLLPAFGLAKLAPDGRLLSQTAKICSDFDTLPELQEDKGKLMEWLNEAPLTANERREALEYKKSSEPGMETVTSSETMTPIDAEDPELTAALDQISMLENGTNAINNGANRTNGKRQIPA